MLLVLIVASVVFGLFLLGVVSIAAALGAAAAEPDATQPVRWDARESAPSLQHA